MPEAEVSLRLAFWLVHSGRAREAIDVAIDGAQIRTGNTVHFQIEQFMDEMGWGKTSQSESWRGEYRSNKFDSTLIIHSRPGTGDVVAKLNSGQTLRVESKKGPLYQTKGSKEYPLIREALGQLLTVEKVDVDDILAVAVPHSEKFVSLANRWRSYPLIARFNIRILTVDRNGEVHGPG